MSIVFSTILASAYLYFVFQIGSIRPGRMKNSVLFLLVNIAIGLGVLFSRVYIGFLVATLLMVLFDLFYDEENFFSQWKWITLFGGSVSGIYFIHQMPKESSEIMALIAIFLGMYLLLAAYRRSLEAKTHLLVIALYALYLYLTYTFRETVYAFSMLVIAIATFMALETMLAGYNSTFQRKTTQFQQELLMNQYEEVKNIYLSMRGFRHDYHNHIQIIKAHLAVNQLDLVDEYLLQLEGELERIDSSVRSGNLMLDAILNSKISIAEKHGIQVICKAEVQEVLPLTDIDLCVILGNLLDNAIESCQKITEDRFIRIYIAVIKNQLYMSIQNAAKEELDFNEKHYISTKRGNHGLGMKRVEVLVDKYDGYLNLQNEPGIFAAEFTMPV